MLDISKSAGPDDINASMLKELAVVISKPLSMLFNNSLKMGTVPSEWKMAYIAPIHKKNDRKMVSNYRPISLTCITCKVMEKIIYQQIIDHIQINNYISDSQHGFLNSQLLEIMNKWTLACDDDIQIDCIYLDFQKAFDSVSHKLLIHKLRMYIFLEPIMSWLTSFNE